MKGCPHGLGLWGRGPCFRGIHEFFDEVVKLGIKTDEGASAFSKIYGKIKTLPNGLKVQRVREGKDATKVAVIGRKMPGVVSSTVDHLGSGATSFKLKPEELKELSDEARKYADGRIPYDEIKKTNAYRLNKEWIEKMKNDGYTIIDMGDPTQANSREGLSAFYEMEKQIIFGDR